MFLAISFLPRFMPDRCINVTDSVLEKGYPTSIPAGGDSFAIGSLIMFIGYAL